MGWPYAETDGKITRGQSIPSTERRTPICPRRGSDLAKFTFENLHPPVFLLASYLAGPHLAATASYHSLFCCRTLVRHEPPGTRGQPHRAVLARLLSRRFAFLTAARLARDS
jgi:hypothetical protein